MCLFFAAPYYRSPLGIKRTRRDYSQRHNLSPVGRSLQPTGSPPGSESPGLGSPIGPGGTRLEEILDQGQLDPTPPRRRFGVPTALGVDRGKAGSSSSSATSHWIGLPATPAAATLICPCTATLVCPRRRSVVLVGALLAGPLTSDEAAWALAAIGPMRLYSGPESSLVGGSKTLGMT
jgi:hypothetical protein